MAHSESHTSKISTFFTLKSKKQYQERLFIYWLIYFQNQSLKYKGQKIEISFVYSIDLELSLMCKITDCLLNTTVTLKILLYKCML